MTGLGLYCVFVGGDVRAGSSVVGLKWSLESCGLCVSQLNGSSLFRGMYESLWLVTGGYSL